MILERDGDTSHDSGDTALGARLMIMVTLLAFGDAAHGSPAAHDLGDAVHDSGGAAHACGVADS